MTQPTFLGRTANVLIAPQEVSSSAPTKRSQRTLLSMLLLAMLVLPLTQTSIMPILPSLAREFGVSVSAVSWTITANLLAAAVLTPLLGRCGDLLGHKRALLIALSGPVAGSLLAAVTHSFALLVAARVFQGASAGVLPLAISVIRTELPGLRSGPALISASMGVGSGLGVLTAGLLMARWSYHSVFWALFALSLLALAGVALIAPSRQVGNIAAKPDTWGALALAGWLVPLLISISRGNSWGWTDPRTTGMLALAVVVATLWVVIEQRVAHPLIDMTMLAHPTFACTGFAAALTGFGMYGAYMMTSEFAQTPPTWGFGFGATVLGAGFMLLPNSLGNLAVVSVGSRLITRYGPRLSLALGSAVSAAGMTMFIFRYQNVLDLYLISTMFGFGTGLAFGAIPTLLNSAVAPKDTGVANGMNAVSRTIGSAIGSAVMGAVLTSVTQSHSTAPSLLAFQVAFGITAIAFTLAALAPFAIRGTSRQRVRPIRVGESR
jgi:MFS family permease